MRDVIEGCLFWILFFKPRKMELAPQERELAGMLGTFSKDAFLFCSKIH